MSIVGVFGRAGSHAPIYPLALQHSTDLQRSGRSEVLTAPGSGGGPSISPPPMIRRNASGAFGTPDRNGSILPVSSPESDKTRRGRSSNQRTALIIGGVVLFLLGVWWRSRGGSESAPAITAVQTDLRVAAEAQEAARKTPAPAPRAEAAAQPTPDSAAGKAAIATGAEAEREQARRSHEQVAMAEAIRQEEEMMKKYSEKQAANSPEPPVPEGGEVQGQQLPEVKCSDRNPTEECSAWASHGECTRNPGFMRAHCRRGRHLRTPSPPPS